MMEILCDDSTSCKEACDNNYTTEADNDKPLT